MSQVIQTQIVGKLYPLRFLHYVVAPVAQEPPTDSRQEQSAIAVGVEEGQDRSYGEKKSSESIIKYLGVFVGEPLFFQIFTLCYLVQLCLV